MAAPATKRKPKAKTKKRTVAGGGRYAPEAKLTPRANGKHPGGRPPKYHPDMARDAERLCANHGATDAQLADFFGVTISTIWCWQSDHAEFSSALKIGKEPANERAKRSLYQRAIGYSYDAEKIFMPAGAEEPVKVPYREHVPPDPTSAIFFLKNRLPDEFRDRREVDTTVHAPPEVEARRQQVLNALLDLIEEGKPLQMIDVTPPGKKV